MIFRIYIYCCQNLLIKYYIKSKNFNLFKFNLIYTKIHNKKENLYKKGYSRKRITESGNLRCHPGMYATSSNVQAPT